VADRCGISRANLAGRLHPDQRRRVMAGSFAGFACLVVWSAPGSVEALIPGRVRGYGTPEEVLR
jgi:hypothetical protein